MQIQREDRRHWLRFVVFVAVVSTTANAADRPPGVNRPAGDLVTLRNGSKLRGVLFERTDKSVTLLVSAKWLSAANAKQYEMARRKNVEENKAGLEQLIERLDAAQKPAGDAAVMAFLKQQLEDAEAELVKADKFEPEFLWLTLPIKDVERVDAATPEHRQLLTWAWSEGLDRAETRTSEELSRELKARDVSPVGWPLSLIERLPAREQADEEWAARRALVEYSLRQRLDFQGTGDVLARAGKELPQAEIGQLLIELLRQQLQTQLGDLLGEPRPVKTPRSSPDNTARTESLKKAIQTAESEQRHGFRVTRLELANDFQQALVTTQFVARVSDSSWQPVFQHIERANAQLPRPEIEKRIQDDPQVKQVLELTRQLGGAAEKPIQQAIRFGAATMIAQQTCDREFAAFRDLYLSSLAKPPLSVNRADR